MYFFEIFDHCVISVDIYKKQFETWKSVVHGEIFQNWCRSDVGNTMLISEYWFSWMMFFRKRTMDAIRTLIRWAKESLEKKIDNFYNTYLFQYSVPIKFAKFCESIRNQNFSTSAWNLFTFWYKKLANNWNKVYTKHFHGKSSHTYPSVMYS